MNAVVIAVHDKHSIHSLGWNTSLPTLKYICNIHIKQFVNFTDLTMTYSQIKTSSPALDNGTSNKCSFDLVGTEHKAERRQETDREADVWDGIRRTRL